MLVDQRRSRPDRGRVTVLGPLTATRHGDPVPLGGDAGRVVAHLAVHRGPQRRAAVRADLGGATEELLDAAVAAAGGLVVADGDTLALDPAVDTDLDDAMALVRALAAAPHAVPADADPALLRADLLPDETGTWVAVERARFRQIRLNALEELSGALSAAGRHAEAVALAEETVRSFPSRETARRALIEAHLAQGGIAEAVAQYDEYQELLRSSVGGPPSSGWEAGLLEGLLPPEPAWPVLRVNRSMQRVGMPLPGGRPVRTGARRLVSGGTVR